ncbi:MAG: cell division protein FtsZ [Ktedonobacterales bacterium]
MGPSEWSDIARQRRGNPFHLDGADDTWERRRPVPSGDPATHNAQNTPAEQQKDTPTEQQQEPPIQPGVARMLAVGIGGAGTNALNRMIDAGVRGVEFLAMNTDAQALEMSRAPHRQRIGETLTRGQGAGGDPEIGRRAAEESYTAIQQALAGADMVFITAGMGGGTGTGASPLVAQAAREQGALTVAVVTTPFAFERKRKHIGAQGVAALREIVDALIVVPNERLVQLAARDMSAFEAYRLADDVLRQGVQGISDLITIPGLINLDFADIRAVMADAGSALMSIGQATGENRAEVAARGAITNPLLDVDISGARGVVFNITASDDLTMYEVNHIAEIITGAAHPDANVIFGTVHDPSIAGSLKVTVVATGFEPRVAHAAHERQIWPAAQPAGTYQQAARLASPSNPARPARPAPSLARASKPSAPREPDPDVQVVHDAFAVTPLERRADQPVSSPTHARRSILPPHIGNDEGGEGLFSEEAERAHNVHVGSPRTPRGYHGEEFIVNDEDDEEEDHREVETHAPLHMWGRFLNKRR